MRYDRTVLCGIFALVAVGSAVLAGDDIRPLKRVAAPQGAKAEQKSLKETLKSRSESSSPTKRHVPGKSRGDRRTIFGGGGACGVIISASPENGTQDSRQPHPIAAGSETDPAERQGIGSIDEPIVLTTDAIGAGADCFVLCETLEDSILGANGIASVTEDPPGTYSVVLNHAIAPGGWTTVTMAGCEGDDCFVEYLSLPANVDGNDQVGPLDILAIVDILNGVLVAPFGDYSSDADHSGQVGPTDILRVIDLLNGADAYSPWISTERPTNDDCPVFVDLSNDDCGGAVQVGCGESIEIFIAAEGYTSNADDDPTSSCEFAVGGPFGHDASWWYEFVPSGDTAAVTVSMCQTDAAEDVVVTMFDAASTCGTLAELSCDDDSCVPPGQFGPSEFTAPVMVGESYIVLVDRYTGGGGDGPYTVTFTCQSDVPVGACCNDGVCSEAQTQVDCDAGGGTYQGNDSFCGIVNCPVTADNDSCSGALVMECGETHTLLVSDGYTSGGVEEDPTSTCEIDAGGPFTHDASWWYEFTPPAGVEFATVSMCQTADTEDTVMTIFDPASTCADLIEHDCDDDSCAPGFSPSTVTTEVIPGETYFVLVDRYAGGGSTDGPYTIEFSCPPPTGDGACCNPLGDCSDGLSEIACAASGGVFQGDGTDCGAIVCPQPDPDNCADAGPIFDGDTLFDSSSATTDGVDLPATCDEGFGTALGQDIWFEYTSTCTGDVTFSTCNNASYDTRLALYEGCDICPATNDDLVACNDDGDGCADFTSTMVASLVEGDCYTLRIGGFGLESGTGTLSISCEPIAEECANGSGDCCAEHGNAGCDDPACCATVCDNDDFCCNGVWDSACAETAIDICAVCSGPGACCDSDGVCADDLNQVECEASGGSFQGTGSDCGSVECPSSANDDCDQAQAMTCGDTNTIFISDGYTSGGVDVDPTSSCELAVGGPFTHDASWWYEFTAPNGVSQVTVSMCQTADTEDTVMSMFTPGSTCGDLIEHECDDDSCAPGFTPSEFTAPVVAGETYFILVDRYTGGTSTDGPYTIEFTCP
jgi:hypothetical protein